MKINKKVYGIPLTTILAIAFVTAGLGYYALATYTINVNQPISITGDGTQSVPTCDAGTTCLSDIPITIKNSDLLDDKSVFVTDNSGDNIVVSYVGKMTFAGKDLATGIVSASTEEIVYSVTGDTFVATGIPETHKLIYYPDMDGGFTENVQNILVYGEVEVTFPSLPVLEDIGDEYCTITILNGENPGVLVCNGAKLWLVEDGYVTALKSGTWTPSKILFETDLITYTVSSTGEVLVPAESTITVYPAFTPDQHTSGGARTIKVTVA